MGNKTNMIFTEQLTVFSVAMPVTTDTIPGIPDTGTQNPSQIVVTLSQLNGNKFTIVDNTTNASKYVVGATLTHTLN